MLWLIYQAGYRSVRLRDCSRLVAARLLDRQSCRRRSARRICSGGVRCVFFPVGLLRRYLEAQEVDGRELLVFDSDEEVSSEVAARMLGVSRPFLSELLEVESISHRRVGNQRRIRVLALHEYSERRKTAEAGLRQMADVINESAGGWNQ